MMVWGLHLMWIPDSLVERNHSQVDFGQMMFLHAWITDKSAMSLFSIYECGAREKKIEKKGISYTGLVVVENCWISRVV